MSPTDDGSSARAQEIQVVLDQCVDRLAEGESVTKEQVIAAHRELMPELGDELRKLSLIERAQRRAHDAGSSSGIGATVEAKGEPWIKDGDTIPGYKIIRELHRGGQGIVYEAFQESTRRKVAVKVMKEGPFAGPGDEARFSREVQVLGQLRHPNIVAIHDSGSSAGHHYFAMDYVPGQQLDAYMATARPSLDDTLRLFAKICEAVNAAHLRGVIHRDLKPGNIRIDTDGEPRILDFGLAKVAIPGLTGEDARPTPAMTVTGQFLGSLPWASPEQAEAVPSKIDVRTDVYSLGVILYHMLTGKFPYDVLGNMRDVIDNILTAEPLRPSTIRGNGDRLTRRINDEVETIVLKCLQKERDRRYQTGGELARDVSHYLNGEPIEAKRDSLAYVLRKQLKRYRIPAVIAASFVLLITAGLIVSVTFWQQAGAERDEAQRQAEIARVVNEFLNEDLLAQADPRVEPDRDIKLRDVLDRAAERVEGRFDEQPLVEAAIHNTLGTTYLSLGEYDAAQQHLERALEIRERVLGDEHPDTLSVSSNLGTLYKDRGRYDDAASLLGRTLDIQRSVLGDDHPDTLSSMNVLAGLYQNQGLYNEAESLYTEMLPITRRVLGNEDERTLMAISNVAGLYKAQGKYDLAEPLYAEMLTIAKRVLGDEHPCTIAGMNNLAGLYMHQGRYEESESLYTEMLPIIRRVLGDEHPQTLVTINNLATVYDAAGRPKDAEPLFAEALAICKRILGDGHPNTLALMNNLAHVYRACGRSEEAESLLVEALAIQKRVLGDEHSRTICSMSNLALLYEDQGRYEEAEPLFVETLAISKRVLGHEHQNTLLFANNLAAFYKTLGRYREAKSLFAETLPVLERVLGAEHPDTLLSMNNLAGLYLAQRRYHEAESLYAQTLSLRERVLGAEHPDTLLTLNRTAELYLEQSRYEDADMLFASLVPTLKRVLGDTHPETLVSVDNWGSLCNEQQRFDEGEELLRECLEIRQEVFDEGDWLIYNTMSLLGKALAGQEKFAEAEPLLIEGYEQMNPPPAKANRKQEGLERIVKLYEAWDAAEPGMGYAELAAEWRAKVEQEPTETEAGD